MAQFLVVRPLRMTTARFASCALLAVFVWIAGCSAPKLAPDPLAGWRELVGPDDKVDLTVLDDFQRYIQSLQPKEQEDAHYVHCYEDGEGQHALRFEVPVNGVDWAHVLIYDKNDKRIKVIRYVSSYYRS